MGAEIQVDGKVAVVEGVGQLTGAPPPVPATCGLALLWSLPVLPPRAPRKSPCIHYIERGYENLVGKLQGVGADIQIVNIPEEEVGQEAV